MMDEKDEQIKRLVDLFGEYAEYLGVPGAGNLAKACEYEDKFKELLCEFNGHNFVPDQCNIPEHDFCCRCGKTVVALGYKYDDLEQRYVKVI